MKKFLLVFSFIALFFTSAFSYPSINLINTRSAEEKILISVTEIDYIEYLYINEQWYQITHYTDGTIGVMPVQRPPDD